MTIDYIREEFQKAKEMRATHLLMVKTPDDYTGDRHVARVYPEDSVHQVVADLGKDCEEVYNLSMDMEAQLAESRAWHLDFEHIAPVSIPDPNYAANDILAEIKAERQRQIDKEGWSLEHDDKHTHAELLAAAASYLLVCFSPLVSLRPIMWPWDLSFWKPKSRRENLIRASALIVAELERMDRAGEK